MRDVIVIGGGAIGLGIARELASHKLSVLVVERDVPGQGTSRAAAGMLAPQSEAASAGPLFALSMESLRIYPAWAAALQEETGIDCGYAASGVLQLASSVAELETLKQRLAWQRNVGWTGTALSASEARELEPNITLPVAGAIWLPDEQQITPRRLTRALAESCTARGVEIRAGQQVDEILVSGGRAVGVRVAGSPIPAGLVIVAAGVWSPGIPGLDPAIPVFPRKGQILSLSTPAGSFRRMIRWGSVYAVPRVAELVIGATNEDAGFDRGLTPAGVGGLLVEAQRLASFTASCPILEMWTGLRPTTPDELPVIGPSNIDSMLYATGHYRNGILLTPVTAAIIGSLVTKQSLPAGIEAFSPNRFAL